MDHLRLSEDSWEYPEVPYLDSARVFVYDNAEQTRFLERKGWSWPEIRAIAQMKPSTVDGHTAEHAAALVQAWLYFGFIHAVTRLPVDTSQYVCCNRSGKLVVTSKPLLGHLRRWQDMLASQEDQGTNVIAQVDMLWKIYHYFLAHVAVVWRDFLPHEVGASIVILHQTIALAKLSMYPHSYSPPSLCNFHDYFHKQIRAPLVDHDWCTTTIQRLGQRLSPLTLYHMASIKNTLPSKSVSHAACSNFQCHASKPAAGILKPQHSALDCRCQLIPSTQDKVTLIVEEGCIPLLSFSKGTGISIESLSLASPGEDVPYVAISHVWADGLGNPSDNTMYPCQIELMQDSVSQVMQNRSQRQGDALKENSFFWIDTLCVPANAGKAKSTAIAMMEDIYRKATIVLVVDAGLKQLNSIVTSPFQIAISIASSRWWTRLWTLQEGVFAKALYFQLLDIAVSPVDVVQQSRELFSNTSDAPAWDIQTMLVKDALSEVEELSLRELRSDSGRHILKALSWRFTSRDADETICLAILLKLSISELSQLEEDPKTRMKAFILMQRFFSSSVLFGHGLHEERFEEEGFRWAPYSFLSRTSGPSAYNNMFSSQWIEELPHVEIAYADEQGLHIRSHGFRLDFRNCREPNTYTPMQAAFGGDMICLILEGQQQGVYRLMLTGRSTWSWDAIRTLQAPLFVILPRLIEAGNRSSDGVLVSGSNMTGTAEGEIICRYENRLTVYLAERHLGGEPYIDHRFDANVPYAIQAAALDMEQQWCVR
ncbi:hypothetical protein MMC17_000414 [Xylographa soralifera]|nr:hypothetical protein [Xylographa soralifera]